MSHKVNPNVEIHVSRSSGTFSMTIDGLKPDEEHLVEKLVVIAYESIQEWANQMKGGEPMPLEWFIAKYKGAMGLLIEVENRRPI